MLKIQRQRKFKKSEKGMAIIETIPVLFLLVMVFNFSFGFFGAVHSGILNSIASYNYTIETFRFKSNLMYFRPGVPGTNYAKANNRVHGTVQEGSVAQANGKEEKGKWPATMRGITLNFAKGDARRGLANVNTNQGAESARNYSGKDDSTNIWFADSKYMPVDGTSIQTPRIWIKTVYGICLTTDCGG